MGAAFVNQGLISPRLRLPRKISQKIQDQINAWATETGLPRVHISRILAMSIGEKNSPEPLREYMGD